MTLLLTPAALTARRQALADPVALGGLAASLQRELHAALDVPVPGEKSRLTRHGGRCPSCTVLLTFDPRSPHRHTCPSCRAVYGDSVHHEWWLMNAHLWTAEQCTRAAALGVLCDDQRAAGRADDILATYADRYLQWPNRDNALGPTRPFFSTYLESIWLLHLAVALDLREQADVAARSSGGVIRDRLIAPSAHLIASFPEGRSNREVWHVAARLAAAALLDDARMRDAAADSLRSLLRTGLHTDGSWYEGDNYHLFAHRGLLSAVALAEQAGIEIPAQSMQRFEAGFAAPFRTMLPDGTFPARRDSQYGISLRQYRTADWLECGIARRDTPELRAALAMMYDPAAPEGDTGRAGSTADAERNQRGVRLTRADCSWRALLCAPIDLPLLVAAVPRSELLEGQGLAVFRRDAGRFWVGLDYGDPGAGHGHPDRLNLVIATDTHRWLDDVGTGSYTSPTLAWYRSSMAHNAPMVNGADQGPASGVLRAHDEQGDAGWVVAHCTDTASGVRFVRTIVVMCDYVLDELTWDSAVPVVVDLPVQGAVRDDFSGAPWCALAADEPPVAHLSQRLGQSIEAGRVCRLVCAALPSPAVPDCSDEERFALQLWTETAAWLWRAETIGPPAGQPHGLVSLRQSGQSGRSIRLYTATTTALRLDVDGAAYIVRRPEGITDRHRRIPEGWRVENVETASVRLLRGVRDETTASIASIPPLPPMSQSECRLPPDGSVHITLGEPQYLPTEVPWHEAGRPTADVCVQAPHDGVVIVAVVVHIHRAPYFAAARNVNPLDNELSDVNSDGVQLHWRSLRDGTTWNSALAVPERGAVRLTAAQGALDGLIAAWEPSDAGYTMRFSVPWPAGALALTVAVCVNDTPPDRERRRGQLVLGNRDARSAYLRGARHASDGAVRIVFEPQHP